MRSKEILTMSDQHRYVYDLSEGSADMKPLLGGKGAGVAEMNRVGVPVPDAFTVTTEACVETMRHDGVWPDALADQISEGLKRLEQRTGMTLGDPENPLLVSVRSGAVMSMPGMMDTILNLGHLRRHRSRRWAARPATSGSPGTATAGSSRCTARWSRGSTRTSTRTPSPR
jgi:phosphoenolpyruvate synthase/pyruvate phosphate dikinase